MKFPHWHSVNCAKILLCRGFSVKHFFGIFPVILRFLLHRVRFHGKIITKICSESECHRFSLCEWGWKSRQKRDDVFQGKFIIFPSNQCFKKVELIPRKIFQRARFCSGNFNEKSTFKVQVSTISCF